MCPVLISTRLDKCTHRMYLRGEKRPENSLSEAGPTAEVPEVSFTTESREILKRKLQ